MARVALVTGGSRGIGAAISKALKAAGYKVAANYAGNDEAAAAFTKETGIATYKWSVADYDACAEGIRKVEADLGPVDVLVNNAGIYLPGGVSDEREGSLETLLETNLYSAYHLTRALLPLMVPHRRGHIFNMCSIASILAYPNGGSYSISKFALLGFSKCLREEMKTKGVKVTAILPGATWSDSWHGANFPADRLMQASDIAKAVWGCYNLSDAAVVEELLIRPQLGDL